MTGQSLDFPRVVLLSCSISAGTPWTVLLASLLLLLYDFCLSFSYHLLPVANPKSMTQPSHVRPAITIVLPDARLALSSPCTKPYWASLLSTSHLELSLRILFPGYQPSATSRALSLYSANIITLAWLFRFYLSQFQTFGKAERLI